MHICRENLFLHFQLMQSNLRYPNNLEVVLAVYCMFGNYSTWGPRFTWLIMTGRTSFKIAVIGEFPSIPKCT